MTSDGDGESSGLVTKVGGWLRVKSKERKSCPDGSGAETRPLEADCYAKMKLSAPEIVHATTIHDPAVTRPQAGVFTEPAVEAKSERLQTLIGFSSDRAVAVELGKVVESVETVLVELLALRFEEGKGRGVQFHTAHQARVTPGNVFVQTPDTAIAASENLFRGNEPVVRDLPVGAEEEGKLGRQLDVAFYPAGEVVVARRGTRSESTKVGVVVSFGDVSGAIGESGIETGVAVIVREGDIVTDPELEDFGGSGGDAGTAEQDVRVGALEVPAERKVLANCFQA